MQPDLFDTLLQEKPSAARVAAIEKTVIAAIKPVRPMPSNTALILVCTAAFLVLTVAVGSLFGLLGFHARSLPQMLIEYSTVMASAVLLSVSVVSEMAPGSRIRVPVSLAIVVPLLALALSSPLLFPDFARNRFLQSGIPCLRLGTFCAAGGALLSWAFLRLGYINDPMRASLSAAALSGLLGVGVLALHCPLLNAAHILVWHLGVLAIAIAGGAWAGYAASR